MTDNEDIELRVRIQKDMVKDALKEGLKEWLNEKIQDVGLWTIRAFFAACLVALVYFVLTMNGWKGPTK